MLFGCRNSPYCVLTALAVYGFPFLSVLPQSQPVPTWIYFRDKPAVHFAPPELLAKELGISERALHRRSKVLPPDRLIDNRDYPVSQEYIRQIEATGAVVKSVSRWLNAVSVTADGSQMQSVLSLPFVIRAQPVAALAHPPVIIEPMIPLASLGKTSTSLLNYGNSFIQLSNIRVLNLHDLGIDGSGVVVGIIDNGFNNHTTHNALKSIKVLAEYDFIHRIPSTEHQPWEQVPTQGNHGAATLSALAGFESGSLIGAAYGASLILAKTEMDSVEVPAEEDLYVEALEWMEQLGADVVSTSLGYIDWYPYDSLDGQTAITTKAARVAASKGVLLVTAAGNEGWFRLPGVTGTLIAPADADSIIAVGATHSDGYLANFSSTGPTADDRIKPEVVAQGVSVVAASGGTSGYIAASGTSLSTPLVAGTAALILSAQPDLTPMQIRESLLQTARRISDPFYPSITSVYPNNLYGHGMIDAAAALVYHGVAFSSKPRVIASDSTLSVYVSIVSNVPLVTDSLALFYQTSSGASFQRVVFSPTSVSNLLVATIPRGADSTWPRGYWAATDQNGARRMSPKGAPDSLFALPRYLVSSIPGVNSSPTSFLLYPNFPNPFNAGTTILFDAPGVHDVELLIFDILGRRVKTVYRGPSSPGLNIYRWDGTDENGRQVSTGMYLARLLSGSTGLTRKLLLLR